MRTVSLLLLLAACRTKSPDTSDTDVLDTDTNDTTDTDTSDTDTIDTDNVDTDVVDTDTAATDGDGDGKTGADDCDDTNPDVYAGAPETCDGLDDDCDGQTDEDATDASTWYADADGDLFGDRDTSAVACEAPTGFVGDDADCDDLDAAVNPAATELCNGHDDDCDGTIDTSAVDAGVWYADADSDTFGDVAAATIACDAPQGYVADATDCDDKNNTVSPAATEVCNTQDDDCDGLTDEGVQSTFHDDADGDNFGDPAVTLAACTAPPGYVVDATDCDDARALVHPGGAEICNLLDDDCDAQIDEGVQLAWYHDADSDTFGNAAETAQACVAPQGFVADKTDCNDAVATTHPGATETCNAVDDNCNGVVDEGVKSNFYRDADNDTYGIATNTVAACTAPSGFVASNSDCNDTNAAVHPGATETCNLTDDNCNNLVDEGVTNTYYRDVDIDGFGTSSTTLTGCSAPGGYVGNNTDCNDANARIHPGAIEACNSVDDNCDGTVDNSAMVGFYKFDEGSGTALVDATAGGHDGTHTGTYSAGKSGSALTLNGTQGGVVNGLIWGASDANFTVSYWLYTPSAGTGSWRTVLHHGNIDTERTSAHFLAPSTLNDYACVSTTTNGNEYGTPPLLTTNTWTHIADVKSTGSHKVYVNGVLSVTTAITASVGFTAPTYIGKDPWYTGLDGKIDQLRIYCFAQTQAQIAADITADGG